MAAGVCTSPNGIIGCKSSTCPGGSINANLNSYRFYAEEAKNPGLKDPMFEDERESLEVNMEVLMDAISEDFIELTGEEQKEVLASFTPEEKTAFNNTVPARIINGNAPLFDAEELDSMFKAYKYAALWSSVDENGDQLSSKYAVADFDEANSEKELESLKQFIEDNKGLLLAAQNRLYGDEIDNLANDFLFTRNGEGVGFWDRTELKENKLGARLTESASKYRTITAVVGDDNKIYFE